MATDYREELRRVRREQADAALSDFMQPLPEPRPPHNGTDTSKAAAREVLHTFSARRDRLVAALADRPAGMTRNELALATGMPKDSVNSAANSCVKLTMLVEDSAWTRDGKKILYHPKHAPQREARAA
jgi:Tfp pilus assembly protein PilE